MRASATATAAWPTTASEQTTVNSSHALNVTKTGPANVAAGGQITYTISWSVTGNEAAQSLVIEDTTPPNTTFARASGAATIDNPGVGNSGVVRWRLGNQNPGASGSRDAGGQRGQPAAQRARPSTTPPASWTATTAPRPRRPGTTTVNSSHTFTLSKTDTPDPVTPDGVINYNIHWTVTGNETGVKVSSSPMPSRLNTTLCNVRRVRADGRLRALGSGRSRSRLQRRCLPAGAGRTRRSSAER